ncbi:ShlB/FhaC/HecB family hemolysin secretion/activation protein [Kordia sp. SMS9]|uniref:ShlB/FhaC/HecB family hemolysin secretion/activation protein n=1 Tax=Kordia sp. SMS9 TaxID=2282170 RepID=UPI000E0CD11C|nr:ShlB/FhaC/HecB family hemolysin secretion/activation protein [Kordia sp. SMS9]
MKKSTLHILLLFFALFCTFSVSGQTLQINGNSDDEQQVIDATNYKRSHENIKSVVDELASLQKALFAVGYFDASYTKLEKVSDSVYQSTFSLNTKYTSLNITYNSDTLDESLLKVFNLQYTDSTFIITPENLTPFLEAIVANFQNTGNPFAEVQLQNILKLKNEQTIKADLGIVVIEKRRLDKVIIKGYEKFPKSYTKNYLRFTSKVFNKEEITKQAKRIDQLPFARQLKDPEILFTKDSTILYVYIEKVKSNFFDGFIGFNSDEDTGNLKLNGYLDLKLMNNLNAGEQFNLLWKNDGNGQTKFLADLRIPYIFNSPIGINAGLDIFRRDSLFNIVNTKLNTFYQINQNNQVHVGIQQTESNNLLENDINPTIDDYTSFFTTAGYTFTKRNNAFSIFPSKVFVGLEAQLGTRTNDAERNEQTKFSFTGNYLWELNNRNFIYVNNTSEALISDQYLTNEKFRLGGIQSIRGFNENSLEATLYSTINTEYRYILSRNSYVHSIIDFTYLQDELTQTDAKLYGFGFGLGIRSKSGLLKINYAVGKVDNAAIKLSESKVHISLATSF